jgi:hypothetical protein
MIQVTQINNSDLMEFAAQVRDEEGESFHHVTMAKRQWQTLSRRECEPARCIEAAFRFLLDREPKEAILPRFDVATISVYFPEFETQLQNYFDRD